MSVWDRYDSRIEAKGGSKRNIVFQRECDFLNRKLPASLSYHTIVLDGEDRNMAVINSDNLNIKTLCSLPGEDIHHGGLVEWMNNHWLVTAKDANNELYTKATMQQCNYLLRWISDENKIVERWCIVEDGTRYLTGEYGDHDYIVTRGDTRIAVTLPRDVETVKLGRKNRFLIDDYDSPTVLAYELSKPFKLGGAFGGDGVVTFVMQECNTEDTDNFELHIANYYDYFPREDVDLEIPDSSDDEVIDVQPGKKVWF